jgi:hypothetical protein
MYDVRRNGSIDMKQELTIKNLKNFLQNYINNWEEMLATEMYWSEKDKERKENWENMLKNKIDTFNYLILMGIDNNFEEERGV